MLLARRLLGVGWCSGPLALVNHNIDNLIFLTLVKRDPFPTFYLSLLGLSLLGFTLRWHFFALYLVAIFLTILVLVVTVEDHLIPV